MLKRNRSQIDSKHSKNRHYFLNNLIYKKVCRILKTREIMKETH